MAQTTQKELLAKISSLEAQLSQVKASNSRTRDELAEVKNHYTNLVNGINQRFEVIENTFRKRK
jgi:peptidoglycan hydrolase CwlO-like protein